MENVPFLERLQRMYKKQKHKAKCTDKRELLCEKVKNQQKLVFESITQNTLIFQKIVIVIYDRMFFPSKI